MKLEINHVTIRTVLGDITKVDFADVIVNSASNSPAGGSGINSAIHKAAGKELMEAYKDLNGCEIGEAKATMAFNLPCRFVIHTVGPIWQGGTHDEMRQLYDCYKNSLKTTMCAPCSKVSSIAFPSISTGVHGFPLEKAAYIAVHAVYDSLIERPQVINRVYWVLYDQQTKDAYDKALAVLAKEYNLNQEKDNYSIIGFYHEYEAYGCFSNWYPAKFEYAGRQFANSEQYMMYHKVMMFGKTDLAEQIMQTSDPMKCKKIAGQKFPEFKHETWESTCYTVMKRGLKAKFRQNPAIRKMLLGTSDAILAECSPTDKKWGIGIDIKDPARLDTSKWEGKNLLGRILMEVRDELRLERVLMLSTHKKLHLSAVSLEPIKEWDTTAGALKRIPQYYNTIHAYGDTIPKHTDREKFYNECTLYEWEIQMKINNGNGLPEAGFYEMKRDIYETAWRMKAMKEAIQKLPTLCVKG